MRYTARLSPENFKIESKDATTNKTDFSFAVDAKDRITIDAYGGDGYHSNYGDGEMVYLGSINATFKTGLDSSDKGSSTYTHAWDIYFDARGGELKFIPNF